MAKMTHTPGPWTIEDPLGPETLWIVEAGKEPHEWRCIAMVCRGDQEITEAEQQANARLIAAAPELLAALKLVERDRLNCNGRVLELHAPIIHAAITKAEGRHDG